MHPTANCAFDVTRLGLLKYDNLEKTYIPTNAEDAVKTISLKLSEEKKNKIAVMTSENLRFECFEGLGRWMRVNWVLSGNSRLACHMRDRSVFNATEMSWVLLNMLQRHQNNSGVDYSGKYDDLAKTTAGAAKNSEK